MVRNAVNLTAAEYRLTHNRRQGFVAILQADTPDSFAESLHLEGLDFNWAVSMTYFMVTVLLISSNLVMKKMSVQERPWNGLLVDLYKPSRAYA